MIINSPAGICRFTCRCTVLWRKVNKAPLSSVASRRHSFKLKDKSSDLASAQYLFT